MTSATDSAGSTGATRTRGPWSPLRVSARTHTGLVREHNEDSFLVAPAMGLCIVSDGMGGHLGGETASRLAVQQVHDDLRAHEELLRGAKPAADVGTCVIAKLLGSAFKSANALVHRRSRESHDLFGMGATATAALFFPGRVIIAHVGDSRAYLVRSGGAACLTDDHTLVADAIRDGTMTIEAARSSQFKNVITRAIGAEPEVTVDLSGVDLIDGDAVLLCSDGLSNLVTEHEIADAASAAAEAATDDGAAQALLDLALRRGGGDNVTVVLARCARGGDGAAAQTVDAELMTGGAAAGLYAAREQ